LKSTQEGNAVALCAGSTRQKRSTLIPHISWATKITPAMPMRNKRIISKARIQPQLPTAMDRRIRQLQINVLNDKNIVNGTLVIKCVQKKWNLIFYQRPPSLA
jgi:hypothetical protein